MIREARASGWAFASASKFPNFDSGKKIALVERAQGGNNWMNG